MSNYKRENGNYKREKENHNGEQESNLADASPLSKLLQADSGRKNGLHKAASNGENRNNANHDDDEDESDSSEPRIALPLNYSLHGDREFTETDTDTVESWVASLAAEAEVFMPKKHTWDDPALFASNNNSDNKVAATMNSSSSHDRNSVHTSLSDAMMKELNDSVSSHNMLMAASLAAEGSALDYDSNNNNDDDSNIADNGSDASYSSRVSIFSFCSDTYNGGAEDVLSIVEETEKVVEMSAILPTTHEECAIKTATQLYSNDIIRVPPSTPINNNNNTTPQSIPTPNETYISATSTEITPHHSPSTNATATVTSSVDSLASNTNIQEESPVSNAAAENNNNTNNNKKKPILDLPDIPLLFPKAAASSPRGLDLITTSNGHKVHKITTAKCPIEARANYIRKMTISRIVTSQKTKQAEFTSILSGRTLRDEQFKEMNANQRQPQPQQRVDNSHQTMQNMAAVYDNIMSTFAHRSVPTPSRHVMTTVTRPGVRQGIKDNSVARIA